VKLSDWAKSQGISYQTAWEWFKHNKLPVKATQTPSGTILVEPILPNAKPRIVIYCRVSSHERKQSLENQIQSCLDYCKSKGYSVDKIYKEIASGMNDSRKQLTFMLESNPSIIVSENKDRLTRFGFNYLNLLLSKLGCSIEIINKDSRDEHDLIKDMISIITSFCCRLYGLRRGHKTAQIIKEQPPND